MKRFISKFIPEFLKIRLHKLYYDTILTAAILFSSRDNLIPPESLVFIGGWDFIKLGEKYLQYFIKFGNLKPNHKVLDVGCGIGRMAIPLTKYLDPNGSYEGFDIVPHGIKWCKKKITSKFPNFSFQIADIYNKRYNLYGRNKASDYNFPYEDGTFDFVFLTSVFTHMLPDDLERYLIEISRVLKENGRCLITFFLLNDESLNLIENKKSSIDLKFNFGNYRTMYIDKPEEAIGFDEKKICNLFEKYKLNMIYPIRYGSWCGRINFTNYQDIILASKA